MTMTETRPTSDPGSAVDVDAPVEPTAVEKVLGSGEYSTIGRGFVIGSLVGLAISAAGLAVAAIDRTTDDGLFGAPSGLWIGSLVGLALLGAAPLLIGLGISVVPRQVASAAIAFPRAAALALWSWVLAGLIYIVGVLLGGGIGGTDIDGARLTNLSLGVILVALSIAASCIATTVLSHRPLGMGLSKVPFFSWSFLVAAPVWILSFASAAAHVYVGQISQAPPARLDLGFQSGIAWLFAAPGVYMLAIPVLGIAADIVANTAKRRIGPYGVLQGLIAAYAILSFGAWTQVSAARQTVIWVLIVVIAGLPVLAVLGGLGDTVRRGGKPSAGPAFVAALVALLLILGGVLVAALQALDTTGKGYLWAFDVSALQWAQGVFLISAALVGGFAGLGHWSRQVFGSDAATKFSGSAISVLVGGGLLATILAVQGIATADSRDGLAAGLFYAVVTVGAALVALGGLSGIAAAVAAGSRTDSIDPEDGLTLEWAPPVDVNSGYGEDQPEYVLSPYPLLDRRGDAGEES